MYAAKRLCGLTAESSSVVSAENGMPKAEVVLEEAAVPDTLQIKRRPPPLFWRSPLITLVQQDLGLHHVYSAYSRVMKLTVS